MSEKSIEFKLFEQSTIDSTPITVDTQNKGKSTALGSLTISLPCTTCNLNELCPGHFGKIEIGIPIFKVAFQKDPGFTFTLKIICGICGNIRNKDLNELLTDIENNNNIITPEHFKRFKIIQANNSTYNKQIMTKCFNATCKTPTTSIQYKNSTFIFNTTQVKQILQVETLYNYCANLPKNYFILLSNNKDKREPIYITDMFYRNNLLIPSNYARQQNNYNGNISDNFSSDLNILLKSESPQNPKKFQSNFDSIDKAKKGSNYTVNNKKLNLSILTNGTHKDSFLRNNINGKRVPGTGRAVIGPGIPLKIGEIDVSNEITGVLADTIYVNYVTLPFIKKELDKATSEKKTEFLYLIKQDHFKKIPYNPINFKTSSRMITPSPGDIIEIKKQEGSYITYGRQPSLHRTNIQSSVIKKINEYTSDGKERTINISTAVASSFNGDFDGDEMTVATFYNPCANIEQGLIMNSKNLLKHQMIGTTMFGLVQDQKIGANLFSQEKSISLDKAFKIFGEYADLIKQPYKKYYDGKELISMIFPEHFTLMDIFDNGELIAENITSSMVAPNSYSSIFNGVSQYYGNQTAITILDIFKYIVENYIRYFGFSVKMSDIIPDPKIITEIELFVRKWVFEIDNKISNFITDLNDKKIYISSFEEVVNLKEKNINVLMTKTRDFLNIILDKYYDNTNQFKKCITVDDLIPLLAFSGLKVNISMMTPTINGKTSLYDYKNNLSLESSGFVINPIIKGLTYNQFTNTIKNEALPQVVNVTSGTSKAGCMGKKLVRKGAGLTFNTDGFMVAGNHIINFNPNELKIHVSEMAKNNIILPNKNLIWFDDLLKIYEIHLKDYFIQITPSDTLEVTKVVNFYLNLNSEIMIYYYSHKDTTLIIDHDKNKDQIKKFFNNINIRFYFGLNNIQYVLYVLLLYFDPSGFMFNNYGEDISSCFSDELLNSVFDKIIFKLQFFMNPGTSFGYEVSNTIQEICTQQQLSSFHGKTKIGGEIKKGTTDKMKQLLDLSKKDKEDIVICYSYNKNDLEIIKNLFDYIALDKISGLIEIIDVNEEKYTIIYCFNINIQILLQKNINFKTVYDMIRIYCERCILIQEFSILQQMTEDFEYLNSYLYVKLEPNIKNTNFDFNTIIWYLKASFEDGIHKGKNINTNLEITSVDSEYIDSSLEIKIRPRYELKFFVESLNDFRHINTANLDFINLPPWLSYNIGGIEYMKLNSFHKASNIINDINYTQCLKNFFDFNFASYKPMNLKTLYNKTEIIKMANHGNNNIIAEAAASNQTDKCNDVYSSLLVSSKPKLGTNSNNFYINPNKFDCLKERDTIVEEAESDSDSDIDNNIISII